MATVTTINPPFNENTTSDISTPFTAPPKEKVLFVSGKKYNPKLPRCEEDWDFEEILGEGSYGNVVQAKEIATSEKAAIKIIDKEKIEKTEDNHLRDKLKWRVVNEIEIHRTLHHPNIVEFKKFYESDIDLCIVLELCSGGELFDRIVEKGRFSEVEASRVTYQITSALFYLHSQGIVHRDLKPENILFVDKRDDSPVKLADFGLSKRLPRDDDGVYPSLRASASGSTAYCAPERLGQLDESIAVDMWSLGCILFFMLMGIPPFYSHKKIKSEEEEEGDIFDAIMEAKITFPRKISHLAKDLVLLLLETDPTKRITAMEMMHHPWIHSSFTELSNNTSSPMPKFSAKKQQLLKSSINSMIDKSYEKLIEGEDELDL